MIAWVYGSGFPKSLDVSKAIDKAAGVEREVVASYRVPNIKGDAYGTMNEKQGGSYETATHNITAPATDAAKQWNGWGTALKPALEPITVARKPLVGTVAENVLAHGTGGLNVDECRVSGEGWGTRTNSPETKQVYGDYAYIKTQAHDLGRWPANFIHDGSEEAIDLLGNSARFFYCAKASKSDRDEGCGSLPLQAAGGMSERRDGSMGSITYNNNHHPTVKPTDLMRYLCRLVTPPGGTVLDPFMGSGSTGKAAVLEGFSFIGIEREAEYIAIADARMPKTYTPDIFSYAL